MSARSLAALALVATLAAAAVSMAGCKPKIGDRCKGNAKVCQDGKTMLVCADGTLQLAPCKGPKGCEAKGEDDATCDISANVAGDACPSFRGFRLCTPDGKSVLECPGDKWTVDACKGPKGCAMGSDGAFCDRTRADVGDGCSSSKPYLCSVDAKNELWCDDSTGKYVATRVCSGPGKCSTETGAVFCDDNGPHDAGEPCKRDTEFCSKDGKQKLVCEKLKFKAIDCPGPHGCKDRICDTGKAFEGMGCEEHDVACSEDGKSMLECKKKKAKDADGMPKDSWEYVKDKDCNGGCILTEHVPGCVMTF
jgi:hypothetical protein